MIANFINRAFDVLALFRFFLSAEPP